MPFGDDTSLRALAVLSVSWFFLKGGTGNSGAAS